MKYSSKDGKISSSNVGCDLELNNVLNLNNLLLKRNRIDALKGVFKELDSCGWNKKNILRFIRVWESRSVEGKYKEYCEMILYTLNKILKRYL
ncbi:MAG: hypothetical protein R3Y26_10720 [Rikenellaceae bacterium]